MVKILPLLSQSLANYYDVADNILTRILLQFNIGNNLKLEIIIMGHKLNMQISRILISFDYNIKTITIWDRHNFDMESIMGQTQSLLL